MWSKGLTARTIANVLEFGIEGSRYEELKMYHIYFYRGKFGLEPRRERPKGYPRYKQKQDEVMAFDEFIETLNKKVRKDTFHHRRKRSYIILHYWTPLRKSEVYERTIEDFETKKGKLIVHLLRKKKKYPRSIKDEPLSIPLVFPLMDEVVEWLKNREWADEEENPKNKPWNFTSQTAWNYVREVFTNYYPHFFRFNWITDATSDPEVSLAELRSKTGLHVSTLNAYIMSSERIQDKLDIRKLERMKIKPLPKSTASIDLNPLQRGRGRPPKPKRRKKKKKTKKIPQEISKIIEPTKTDIYDELKEFEEQMEKEGEM